MILFLEESTFSWLLDASGKRRILGSGSLTDEQADILKQGYPVRVFHPELGGDVIVVLAAQRESTESALQEALDEIREKAALSKLAQRAVACRMEENPY